MRLPLNPTIRVGANYEHSESRNHVLSVCLRKSKSKREYYLHRVCIRRFNNYQQRCVPQYSRSTYCNVRAVGCRLAFKIYAINTNGRF